MDFLVAAIILLKREQKKLLERCSVKDSEKLSHCNYAYYHGLGTAILKLQGLKRRAVKNLGKLSI